MPAATIRTRRPDFTDQYKVTADGVHIGWVEFTADDNLPWLANGVRATTGVSFPTKAAAARFLADRQPSEREPA